MSRIGKLPITLPKGVEVKLGQDIVEVKGPKGSLTTPLCGLLDYEVTAEKVTITRKNTEDRATAQQHGLRRTLLANCVEGVTKGFSKTMEVIGVGYKVAVKGSVSHIRLLLNFLKVLKQKRKVQSSRFLVSTNNWSVKCALKFVVYVCLNHIKEKASNTKMKLFAAKPVSPVLRANRGCRYDAF